MKRAFEKMVGPLVWVWVIAGAAAAHAQLKETVLHSFSGGIDGHQPYAGLIQGTDGALYGTTFSGGSENAGIIFKVMPDGSGSTPIYNFTASQSDPGGAVNPFGLVQGVDGALYGVTGFGGTKGYGMVFKISTDGTGYTVLHEFGMQSTSGYEPAAGLAVGSDGFLYGTTQFGGANGAGGVFKLAPDGTGFQDLYEFGDFPGDGQAPQATLLPGNDGQLYGTTSHGGASAVGGVSGLGTVFRLSTNGGSATILHSFLPADGDGQYPCGAGLAQGPDGTLYGVTQQGGSSANGANSGFGTVFKLNADGSGYTVLHNFSASGVDGKYPNSTLVLGTDGQLYGTTETGGAADAGTVFRLGTDGTNYTVLYEFGKSSTDGQYPVAPLIQAYDGGLFGTTQSGGTSGFGTVFRLAPAPPVFTSLARLPNQAFRLTLKAAPNFEYRIETSEDHRHWAALTNVFNFDGTVQVVDPTAASASKRFYRAVWTP